jgi:hypothetical protein
MASFDRVLAVEACSWHNRSDGAELQRKEPSDGYHGIVGQIASLSRGKSQICAQDDSMRGRRKYGNWLKYMQK